MSRLSHSDMEIAYHPLSPPSPPPSAWDNFVIPAPSLKLDAGMGKKISGSPAWGGGHAGAGTTSPQGAVDGGIRHKQLAAAAAHRAEVRAAQGDQRGAPGSCLGQAAVAKNAASPYQKDIATRAAERALRPWAPYGAGMGERQGAILAHIGPAAGEKFLGGGNDAGGNPTALYENSPIAANAIGEAAGRVSV